MQTFPVFFVATIVLVSARPRPGPPPVYIEEESQMEAPVVPIEACEQTFRNRSGVITTPGYPDHYPHNQNCAYTIDIPGLSNFTVTKFYACHCEVEYSGGCMYDYWKFGPERTCGDVTGQAYEVQTIDGKTIIWFYSDYMVNMNGCYILYSVDPTDQLEEHCPPIPEEWSSQA